MYFLIFLYTWKRLMYESLQQVKGDCEFTFKNVFNVGLFFLSFNHLNLSFFFKRQAWTHFLSPTMISRVYIVHKKKKRYLYLQHTAWT